MIQMLAPILSPRATKHRVGDVGDQGVFVGDVEAPAGGAFVQVHFGIDEALTRDTLCQATDMQGNVIAVAHCVVGGRAALARLAIPEGNGGKLGLWLSAGEGSGHVRIHQRDIVIGVRAAGSLVWLPDWALGCARWRNGGLDVLTTGELLRSKEIVLGADAVGNISFSCHADHPLVLLVSLRDLDKRTIEAGRYWRVEGISSGSVPFGPLPRGRYVISVVAQMLLDRERPYLDALDIDLSIDSAPRNIDDNDDLALPHWGAFNRALHRWCRRSGVVNNFVQAIELRLGREELVSLPQYMSICPTGQCNALCDFCSVTINRTGITKRQLGEDLLERFLRPVRRTVRLYGLEGNGEPTLHRSFPQLVGNLMAGGSQAYLITNGSRFSLSLLPSLIKLESVNVSLNAASARVHEAVMKLDCFDTVVNGIRDIVQMRGYRDPQLSSPALPVVSASFVVTNDNVHEVPDFLHLAERELGVDVVHVRPLSELGDDLGAVEDLRAIVPYQSDIEDLVEAVQDYRAQARSRLDIRFNDAAFRSVRPDPIGAVRRPPGYEGRLLAPRPRHWNAVGTGVAIEWQRATLRLTGTPEVSAWQMTSSDIPVEPGEILSFECSIDVEVGTVGMLVLASDGAILHQLDHTAGRTKRFSATIDAACNRVMRIVVRTLGPVRASIDFERLRKPSMPRVSASDTLAPRRWEVGVSDAKIKWDANVAAIEYSGSPGRYLLKSYAVPVSPGSRVTISIPAQVERGILGAGLLSADQSRWLVSQNVDCDQHFRLVALTGQDRSIRVVFYPASEGPLSAKVDLSYPEVELEQLPEEDVPFVRQEVASIARQESDGDLQANPSPAAAQAASVDPPIQLIPIATAGTHTTSVRRMLASLLPRRRIYCHKPWTDLHNFTVDGRMDVCCIATGPSQERYALGNLNTQNFQDVWNGPTARLFRRTVNSSAVLPPCARCPMSHAYQGMWFDPVHTRSVVREWLFRPAVFRWPVLRFVPRLIWLPLEVVILAVAFRGFRRPLAAEGLRRRLARLAHFASIPYWGARSVFRKAVARTRPLYWYARGALRRLGALT